MIAVETVARLRKLGLDALSGRVSNVADLSRALLGVGLDLVSVSELRRHLDAEAAARAVAVADAAEIVKFGPSG